MCLTCGCGDAHKAMGKNLTYEDVRDVAVANGKTVDDTIETLVATAHKDHEQHREEYERAWDPAS